MKRSDLPIDLPCHVPWDTMSGEGRTRFCTSCEAHVHDLSSMSEGEAKTFLASRADVPTCIRYLANEHDAVLFALVPSGFVPVANLRRSAKRLGAGVGLVGAAALGVLSMIGCGMKERSNEAYTGMVSPTAFGAPKPEVPAAPQPAAPMQTGPIEPYDAGVTDLEAGKK